MPIGKLRNEPGVEAVLLQWRAYAQRIPIGANAVNRHTVAVAAGHCGAVRCPRADAIRERSTEERGDDQHRLRQRASARAPRQEVVASHSGHRHPRAQQLAVIGRSTPKRKAATLRDAPRRRIVRRMVMRDAHLACPTRAGAGWARLPREASPSTRTEATGSLTPWPEENALDYAGLGDDRLVRYRCVRHPTPATII